MAPPTYFIVLCATLVIPYLHPVSAVTGSESGHAINLYNAFTDVVTDVLQKSTREPITGVSRIPVSANLQSPTTSGGGSSSSGGSRHTYAGAAAGHAHGADIKESTRACEIEVPAHCMGTTCPLFCATFRSPRLKQTCQVECTTDKRCMIRPDAGADDPSNAILDGQNRDQLWACIAEKRDPAGTLTGRREQTWKKLETADYKKATGRP